MMRLLAIGLVLFLTAPAHSFDQKLLCGPHADYRPIATRLTPGLIFRIEKCDVAPSHIFGTYHSDDPKLLTLEPALLGTLRASRIALFEVEDNPQVLQQTVRRLLLPSGETLSGKIGKPLFDRLAAILKKRLPANDTATYERLKPWAAAILLDYPPPVDDGTVLDDRLQKTARAAHVGLRGLETPAEQIGFFDTLTAEEQKLLVTDAVENFDEAEALNAKLDAAYRGRDLAEVGVLSKEAFSDIEDEAVARKILDFLVTRRNARMFVRLSPEIRKGGAFVAVGALHLVGPDGLLARLEGAGYLIEQVGSSSTADSH